MTPSSPSPHPSHSAPSPSSSGRPLLEVLRDDEGAATAEYAIVIMAAVSFAGVLVTILRSGAIQSVLTELVKRALTVG